MKPNVKNNSYPLFPSVVIIQSKTLRSDMCLTSQWNALVRIKSDQISPVRLLRSQTVHVHLHIDVDTIVDEQLEAQHPAGGRCGQVQWRAAVVVGLSDVCATVDQLGGQRVVPIQAGHVESRVAENVCVVSLQVQKKGTNRRRQLNRTFCYIFKATAKW